MSPSIKACHIPFPPVPPVFPLKEGIDMDDIGLYSFLFSFISGGKWG
jgi:hypothetical protein